MSKFYSSIQGERGEATRCGHREIRASAQSFDGSIIVSMCEKDGKIHCMIGAQPGSKKYHSINGVCLYNGPIEDLLNNRYALVQKMAYDLLEQEHNNREPRTAAGSLD